jgi:arsenite-transporting ATPase
VGRAPIFRFFGGKGGAGKTTLAAAAALAAAERGREVLVVSTDPAHSLGDALQRRLGPSPRRVPTRRGVLRAAEVDADRAVGRWMATRRPALRAIALRGTFLDGADVDRLLRLSLPGVDELMGLIEVMRLAGARPYDEVVVDTAPTGHTLRLLAMPPMLERLAAVLDRLYAKHRFLRLQLGQDDRPDTSDALIATLEAEALALKTLLRDRARARLTWVTLPEMLSIRESEDAIRALDGLGIAVERIAINRLTRAVRPGCPSCAARRGVERSVIAARPAALRDRVTRVVGARRREPRGRAALRALGRELAGGDTALARWRRRPAARPAARPGHAREAPGWLATLAPPGTRLLLVLGKGGVGKTTCATTVALAAAQRPTPARGRRPGVLLLSTDPAHSLGDVLGAPIDHEARTVPGAPRWLHVRELDAERAFRRERARYLAAVEALLGAGGDRGGPRGTASVDAVYDRAALRSLLELAPPGLDELFGMLGIVDALLTRPGRPARYGLVVVDSAPTGHALRMLGLPETALAWVHALLAILLRYRRVIRLGSLARDLVALSRDLRRFRALLRDGTATRAVVVTRPGRLPRLETARLMARLRALGVGMSAIIVNAMTPAAGGACGACRAAARAEAGEVVALRALVGGRRRQPILLTPALASPPRAVDALTAWGRRWTRASP